ncbi:hypothetical protein NPIL_373251 [Nephila pilipes]|uniref:Uncharacterized protein n=1 Tax=Nephila pilipes TaxID=299642 RepID=A0A8X6QXH9_NEPPI|nr:hypothetical protein NPIL_373251 [Nephila pilipes]
MDTLRRRLAWRSSQTVTELNLNHELPASGNALAHHVSQRCPRACKCNLYITHGTFVNIQFISHRIDRVISQRRLKHQLLNDKQVKS